MKRCRPFIKVFCLTLFLWQWCPVASQTRIQLEQERNKIIQEIETANDNLAQAAANTDHALQELETLTRQITARQNLITNLKKQLDYSIAAIAANADSTIALNNTLSALDSSYQRVMRLAHLRNTARNPFIAIFNATNLNEALLIWRYSNQFKQYVTAKRATVEHLREVVQMKSSTLEEEQLYNHELLAAEKDNFAMLAQTQEKKDKILRELQTKQTAIQAILEAKQAERKQLNNQIENIILAQLSRQASQNKHAPTTAKASFKKKAVPWPVKNGQITVKFGNQPHPSIPNVTITNNGVDIQASQSAPVLATAPGVVIGVTKVPGYDIMIIIDHSDYYTVYSKLTSARVQKGNSLLVGDVIGELGSTGDLHFEIWKGKTKLDPQDWLKKQ